MIYRRCLYQTCFLLCSRTITVVLNAFCMLGWENGIIYVNIGYIFLTVPLGPTWGVCIAMGSDSRGEHPVCNILTAALPVHKLQDF